MKTFRIIIIFALASIFCLVSLVSFGWSAEKPKAPSVVPRLLTPTQVTPSKAIIPFDIKVDDKTSKYLDAFSLSAKLVPRNDSQTAKDAISGKPVSFSVDDKFVGGVTSEVNGNVFISISENYSRQLNLQAGIRAIKVTTTHEGHVIEGYGKLIVQKGTPTFELQDFILPGYIGVDIAGYPVYASGQTITVRAILLDHQSPITHVNVNCVSINEDNGSTKIIKTVQTNNQGGFEWSITLTPDLFSKCKIYCNFCDAHFAVSFENQNYNKSDREFLFRVCPPGTQYSKNCTFPYNNCESCCK